MIASLPTDLFKETIRWRVGALAEQAWSPLVLSRDCEIGSRDSGPQVMTRDGNTTSEIHFIIIICM